MSVSHSSTLSVRFVSSIAAVESSAWDHLAGAGYPFLRHAFLLALEESGCADTEGGWEPCHLLLEKGDELLGCMPLYRKTNSFGEYVFDWAWADAYARHGLHYYPKLIAAIPFTPCAGPRLCLAPGTETAVATNLVIAALQQQVSAEQLSGFHILFPDADQLASLQQPELLLRTGCQYQWFNQQYTDFDAFLDTLNSRKRKNLRKERQRVREQGIGFEVLEGEDITEEHWRRFYRYYSNTYLIRGRAPYLNLDFFLSLGRNMPDALLLVLATRQQVPVAGALFFKGSDTLYGRYWGCDDEYRFLHFETCYYQGIDYCIAQGLKRFDSGAQGEHKIQRGFKPVPTWSLHWVEHPEFRRAIAEFVREEESYISQYLDHAADFLPFRKDLSLAPPKND